MFDGEDLAVDYTVAAGAEPVCQIGATFSNEAERPHPPRLQRGQHFIELLKLDDRIPDGFGFDGGGTEVELLEQFFDPAPGLWIGKPQVRELFRFLLMLMRISPRPSQKLWQKRFQGLAKAQGDNGRPAAAQTKDLPAHNADVLNVDVFDGGAGLDVFGERVAHLLVTVCRLGRKQR